MTKRFQKDVRCAPVKQRAREFVRSYKTIIQPRQVRWSALVRNGSLTGPAKRATISLMKYQAEAKVSPSLGDLLAQAVADRLERDPMLLRIPLENIERWFARGTISNPHGLERWRDLLREAVRSPDAFNRVLALLREDSEEAREWRDFSPFAGVLTVEERRKLIRECSYNH